MDARETRRLTTIVCMLCMGTLAVSLFSLRSEIGRLVAVYRNKARLQSDDPMERRAAVEALGQLGTPGAAAVLVRELRTAMTSSELIDALAGVGHPAVPPLEDLLLDDASGERKRWAVIALGRIGPRAASAVPAILSFLEDHSEEWLCRASAFVALGRIGPDAREAVPVLLARASLEPDADNRRHLASALLRIEPDSREIREVAAPLLIVPETEEQNVPVVGSAVPITADAQAGAPVLSEGEKRVEPRGAPGVR